MENRIHPKHGSCNIPWQPSSADMNQSTHLAIVAILLTALASPQSRAAETSSRALSASKFGADRKLLNAQPDGLLICEAEEFQPDQPTGWRSKNFGENYYAATFANSFLSRKAFLGAPENGPESSASLSVNIPAAGRYLVLSRYEAAYRFETQFSIQIVQSGKPVFRRVYGARKNPKIWAFKEKLKPEVGWSWGATENIVWEGHDAFADLQPGTATLTLIASPQPEPAARRNVDLIMLTTDAAQVADRIEKENYLPLDGMLTQSGDVWVRVKNTGAQPLVFKPGKGQGGGNWQEHSPYWVHLRKWPTPSITVAPGAISDWTEVGSTMDSLAHGQWAWNGNGPFTAEFGLKTAKGDIERIAVFEGNGDLDLAADCDTRYSRRLRKQEDVLPELVKELAPLASIGRAPKRTPVFANTFQPIPGANAHNQALKQFSDLLGISEPQANNPDRKGYIDVRSVPTKDLHEYCMSKIGTAPANISVVSLGDEISLPAPSTPEELAGFAEWLKQRGQDPNTIGPFDKSPQARQSNPARFYWSSRYANAFGINKIKERTAILSKALPNAGIGANYSPHYPQEHLYLGETHKWAQIFRDGGMTMPWSEDYIWQVPVLSPQINHLNIDLFRAGIRHRPEARIHFYVMPHMPNNTPSMWRRLFYGALAHGTKVLNLFEFRTVHAAYTENHVDETPMYQTVTQGLRELGVFEDIVQEGNVQPARTGLWFGETSDIWGDSKGSFAAAKRALYLAIRHHQVPLDILIEPDALDGTLDQYEVLYLSDRHVSRECSERIAAWVKKGGRLFATAGAGMRNELDQPNTTLQDLFGVSETSIDQPADKQIVWIKQDLPFTTPLSETEKMPVLCVRSHLTNRSDTEILTRFTDGTPATIQRSVEKGATTYCAFLPSLSYYKPAIPKRPVDRGATDDAFVHFLPTDLDPNAFRLIGSPLEKVRKPVVCDAPLVETTLIRSKSSALVPVINWTNAPRTEMSVTIDTPLNKASLATGKPIRTQRKGDQLVCTFSLETADAIILRP